MSSRTLPDRNIGGKIKEKNRSRAGTVKPQLSEKFKFKEKLRQSALVQAESREDRTYKYFDQPEEVLLTSGYHHQLSIQDPAYDYTIGGKYIALLF